jgi:uncharacterized HhH-GPD family protein
MGVNAADFSELDGGLSRMLTRLQAEGTATRDPEADQYLRDEPNAVLLGLLYDQRVLAESAFIGPLKLRQRLGHLDMRTIGNMNPDTFRDLFAAPPAVHRFTNTMAARTQEVARAIATLWQGDASNLWREGTCDEVERRVRDLPGFGPLKAKKLKHALFYFGHRDLSED